MSAFQDTELDIKIFGDLRVLISLGHLYLMHRSRIVNLYRCEENFEKQQWYLQSASIYRWQFDRAPSVSMNGTGKSCCRGKCRMDVATVDCTTNDLSGGGDTLYLVVRVVPVRGCQRRAFSRFIEVRFLD
jgi:hypothetical protein